MDVVAKEHQRRQGQVHLQGSAAVGPTWGSPRRGRRAVVWAPGLCSASDAAHVPCQAWMSYLPVLAEAKPAAPSSQRPGPRALGE